MNGYGWWPDDELKRKQAACLKPCELEIGIGNWETASVLARR